MMLRYMVTDRNSGSIPQRVGTVTLTWTSTVLSLVGGRLRLTDQPTKHNLKVFADGLPMNSELCGNFGLVGLNVHVWPTHEN